MELVLWKFFSYNRIPRVIKNLNILKLITVINDLLPVISQRIRIEATMRACVQVTVLYKAMSPGHKMNHVMASRPDKNNLNTMDEKNIITKLAVVHGKRTKTNHTAPTPHYDITTRTMDVRRETHA